jgi:hypothetical protein
MSLSGYFLLQLYVEIREMKNFYPQDFVNQISSIAPFSILSIVKSVVIFAPLNFNYVQQKSKDQRTFEFGAK